MASVVADGTCGPALAGTDPGDDCAEEPLATCGLDGTCDGAGQCTVHADGTPCDEAQICLGGSCVEQACDGDHTVLSANEPRDCTPYRCSIDTNACLARCDSNLDCAPGYVCNAAGACGELPPPAEMLGCAPCAVGRGATGSAHLAWLAGVAWLAWRRRKRHELSDGRFDLLNRRIPDQNSAA